MTDACRFPSVQPWAKLDRERGTRHHLAHHCADVAACLAAIVESTVVRSRLSIAAGRALSDVDLARLQVLVFLHDVGKLLPAFQSKGWSQGPKIWVSEGHVADGLRIFLSGDDVSALAMALRVDVLEQWGVTESLLRAVISHHGRPGPPDLRVLRSDEMRPFMGYDPRVAAAELGSVLPTWFPKAFQDADPLPNNAPAFEHLLCGLTSLADWVGSDACAFPYVAEFKPNYMSQATEAARERVTAIGLGGLHQRATATSVSFESVTGFAIPNAQQRLVGDISSNERLIILEAETGSGKTEAALLRYAQLFIGGHVDGLYFAVPTRAAAVQLHGRVSRATKRLFGVADPEPVLAVPGYIRAGDHVGKALPGWEVLWDDTAEEHQLARRWAAESARRFLAAQVAVGTIDQAMLGALIVKHAHLRAASLARSLLVIDEVHASDAYMTAIQRKLLEGHLAIGGFAMLMSATLGSVARHHWTRANRQPNFETAVAQPYPAVWTSNSAEPLATNHATDRIKSVSMSLHETIDPAVTAELALHHARCGARVLVIRNTVTRAVETLVAVETAATESDRDLLFAVPHAKTGLPVVTLHHSRFSADDRRLLDQAVEQALSTSTTRPSGGRIVIGSQTLEQSLDIDADLLITDLCPVDVLLQRVGRLHRHVLPRPAGYERARCIVLSRDGGLDGLIDPVATFDNGLGGWSTKGGGLEGIYLDVSILELTRRLVRDLAEWIIPQMNRMLVESATHPERIKLLNEELGPTWRAHHDRVLGRVFALRGAASNVFLDRGRSYGELRFPAYLEDAIRTRLGAEGARLTFAEPFSTGPFGQPLVALVLPEHMSRGLSTNEPIVATSDSTELIFDVDTQQFTYSRYGAARIGKRAQSPSGTTF